MNNFEIGDITDADSQPNQETRLIVTIKPSGSITVRKMRLGKVIHVGLCDLYLQTVCTSFRKRP